MAESTRNTLTSLDPQSPFVVETHTLGRRPGATRQETRTVPASANFGVELIGVPEGADVELSFRLEAVMEGVLASGTVRAPLSGECSRCLDAMSTDIEVDFQELFVYPESETAGEDEYRLEGDLLDLEQVVRDAVVLALPMSPLCRDDCPGLCAECGIRLADAEPGHGHGGAVDPRWAALEKLKDTSTDDNQES